MRAKSTRVLLTCVLVLQLAGSVSHVSAQEADPSPEAVSDQSAPDLDGTQQADVAPSQDVSSPTPSATSVVVVDTPTAQPTSTPQVSFTTRNGPRTEDQLRQELSRAGYSGPWDVGTMLVVYDRTTAPTPTPKPTVVPTEAPTLNPLFFECSAMAADVSSLQQPADQTQLAVAARNPRQIRAIAAGVRSRKYTSGAIPLVNAFVTYADAAAAEAEIREGWPLLILASQQPNGALIIAAAQADLDRAQSQEQVALVQFQQAGRDLLAHCSV